MIATKTRRLDSSERRFSEEASGSVYIIVGHARDLGRCRKRRRAVYIIVGKILGRGVGHARDLLYSNNTSNNNDNNTINMYNNNDGNDYDNDNNYDTLVITFNIVVSIIIIIISIVIISIIVIIITNIIF